MSPPLVPPIKCQGIKTKLVAEISKLANDDPSVRWVEPFCGSLAVVLNIQPKQALLCDTNVHIIRFYKDIQSRAITPATARDFLSDEGENLRTKGEAYFYEVRQRFNTEPSSLDFLFLNRSCFNGVMRFNKSGKFNVPFCRKPERFSPAYVTKIVNQIQGVAKALTCFDWQFEVSDFRNTLKQTKPGDLVYADPPYAGRHVDYYNSWSDQDEDDLATMLSALPCRFILSTWHSNEFRTNQHIEKNWSSQSFQIATREHYYHVGATEELRHPMIEALVTNFYHNHNANEQKKLLQPLLAFEMHGELQG
jgi:DNA adenine methylase